MTCIAQCSEILNTKRFRAIKTLRIMEKLNNKTSNICRHVTSKRFDFKKTKMFYLLGCNVKRFADLAAQELLNTLL